MIFGTIVFGAIFLARQVYEFTYFVHALGMNSPYRPARGENRRFGQLLYVLTGTHALTLQSVFFGYLGWFVYSFTGKMSTVHAIDVECCGLYWHFVDIV